MPVALSSDIRNRFQVLHFEGDSPREIGRRLLLPAATTVRFADHLRRTDDLSPKPTRVAGDMAATYRLNYVRIRSLSDGTRDWLEKASL